MSLPTGPSYSQGGDFGRCTGLVQGDSPHEQEGAANHGASILPEIFESVWRQLGIAHGIPDVPMPEISLQNQLGLEPWD
jgi:hypothetical protein